MTDQSLAGAGNNVEAIDMATSAPVTMGWLMILGGIVVVGMAFFFDVGVNSGAGGLYGLPDRVANSDKIAIRNMILACGLASFISGWISLSTGLILEKLKRP